MNRLQSWRKQQGPHEAAVAGVTVHSLQVPKAVPEAAVVMVGAHEPTSVQEAADVMPARSLQVLQRCFLVASETLQAGSAEPPQMEALELVAEQVLEHC